MGFRPAQRDAMLSGKTLPYDAEVEYLGLTGVEQIDTGIVPTLKDTYYIDFMSTASTPSGIWISGYGLWDAVPNYWIFLKLCYSTTGVQAWSFKSDSPTYTYAINSNLFNDRKTHVVFSLKNKLVSVRNDVLDRQTSIPVDHDPAADQPSILLRDGRWTGRIYGWVVERDGAIIQKCIPVRFTNEFGVSEGAMYDRVSGQLFRNAGTGAFVIGHDKSAANGGGGV